MNQDIDKTKHRRIDPQGFSSLIGDVKAPAIKKVEDVERVIENFMTAGDRSKPFIERFRAFVAGENDLGRTVGRITDFVTLFVPWGDKVNAVRAVINRKAKPRKMPRLKEKSTKEGIAVVASILALVGIEMDVAVLSEMVQNIIQGVALTVGGVAGLLAYFRREKTDDDDIEENSAPES